MTRQSWNRRWRSWRKPVAPTEGRHIQPTETLHLGALAFAGQYRSAITTKMKYNREYFIAKFEAIPEEKWTTGECCNAFGQCCALGHCGMHKLPDALEEYTEEAQALMGLLSPLVNPTDPVKSVYIVNDRNAIAYPQLRDILQGTHIPKDRVL